MVWPLGEKNNKNKCKCQDSYQPSRGPEDRSSPKAHQRFSVLEAGLELVTPCRCRGIVSSLVPASHTQGVGRFHRGTDRGRQLADLPRPSPGSPFLYLLVGGASGPPGWGRFTFASLLGRNLMERIQPDTGYGKYTKSYQKKKKGARACFLPRRGWPTARCDSHMIKPAAVHDLRIH